MLAMALVAIGGLAGPATAAGRHAALIVDANTGQVISASAADEPRYPASLTKMMTLYVVFGLIEQGKLSYTTKIPFSETAVGVPPTKLGIAVGGQVALLDAIKGLIVKSANDASVAIAEHVSGSEAKFAQLMTDTARRIGMTSSTFKNAHGLPHGEQVTTARDMITLGLRLQDDFPRHYALFSARDFRYSGETHRNHNTLLGTYEGTDGIKTGYISSSGYNLVANVRRGKKHVIGVVFGGSSAGTRNQTMKTLLNIALFKASDTKTRAAVPVAQARPVPTPQSAPRPTAVAKADRNEKLQPPMAPSPAMAAPRGGTPVAEARVPTIETTRVRTVDIAGLPPTAMPPAGALPPAPAPVSPTPPPPQASRQPEPPPLRMHAPALAPPTLVAPPHALPRREAAAAPPIANDAGQGLRPSLGAAPSTLQQQADNIARGQAPLAQERTQVASATALPPAGSLSRLNGPRAAGEAGAQIQVGAYGTAVEAERALAAIRQKAADLLGQAPGAAIAATANGRAVFRARYSGFDPARAGQVCTELRRRQIDCLVTRE